VLESETDVKVPRFGAYDEAILFWSTNVKAIPPFLQWISVAIILVRLPDFALDAQETP